MSSSESRSVAVSVVMPMYNAERFLRQGVDSILGQSFSDFEFVVVNDGSTDRSLEILESYDDARIVLLDRPHRGFALSLNEGIRESRGRYIARMDADDIAAEDRLLRQHEFMENHSEVGLLGGQAVLIDELGNPLEQLRRPTTGREIEKYIEYACPVIHSTYFARKAVFEATNGYRCIPPVEDYDFLFRVHEAGFSIRNLSETLVSYRATSDGMTLKNLQRAIVFCLEVQRMHRRRTWLRESDHESMAKLEAYDKKSNAWFSLVYRARKRLLNARQGRGRLPRQLLTASAALISILHIHLFLNGLNTVRALRHVG